MTDDQEFEWLTVTEFALRYRLHEQTVYAAIRDGNFAYKYERPTQRTIRIRVPRGNVIDDRTKSV